MTAHVEQITPEDKEFDKGCVNEARHWRIKSGDSCSYCGGSKALPVWVIYEGRECGFCNGHGGINDAECFPCAGTGIVNDRELARATSEADAERVRAAFDALRLWVAAVEGADFIRIEPSYEPLRAALAATDRVLGSPAWEVTYTWDDHGRETIRRTCPLCHHSIHDHAPDCRSLHIGQVGC